MFLPKEGREKKKKCCSICCLLAQNLHLAMSSGIGPQSNLFSIHPRWNHLIWFPCEKLLSSLCATSSLNSPLATRSSLTSVRLILKVERSSSCRLKKSSKSVIISFLPCFSAQRSTSRKCVEESVGQLCCFIGVNPLFSHQTTKAVRVEPAGSVRRRWGFRW